MPDSQFKFHIQSPETDIIAEKIEKILSDELHVKPERWAKNQSTTERTRSVDPIALITMIISIPSAILATVDAIERMKKRQQTENVLEKIGQLIANHPQASIKLEAPDGSFLHVEKGNAARLLDAAQGDDK